MRLQLLNAVAAVALTRSIGLLAAESSAAEAASSDSPVPRSLIAVEAKLASRQPPQAPPLVELPETVVVGQPAPTPSAVAESQRQPITSQPPANDRPFMKGYYSDQPLSGVMLSVPWLDLPFTANVVNQALISDQQAVRVQDLLRNLPGVQPLPSSVIDPDQLLVRGFPLGQFDTRWNGFHSIPLTQRDLASIERVELLRGPSSVLYGGGQPAGVINYVTKQPTAHHFFTAQEQLGSFQFNRFTFDTGGPMVANGSVRGRLNLAKEEANSFRDFVASDRFFIDPVVAWDWDENTTVTWETEYQHARYTLDRGIPFYRGQLTGVPIGRFLGEPNDIAQADDVRTSLRIVHALSDDCNLYVGWHGQFHPQANFSGSQPLLLAPAGLGAPDSFLIRSRGEAVSNNEQFHNLQARVEAKSDWLGVDHNWVAGGESFWEAIPSFKFQQSNPFATPLFIDIFNPVYNDNRFGGPNPPLPLELSLLQHQHRFGLFWNDLVEVNPAWKLLVGVRQDWATLRQTATTTIPAGFGSTAFAPLTNAVTDVSSTTFVATKPRVGLVYEPFDDVSLYTSYSESFRPAFGRKLNGTPLPPELGHQFESGVKLQLTERLSASGAGYYIAKQNVIVADPNNALFNLQLGEQTSRGCEFDIQGEITSDWNLVATYAYVDSRVANDLRPELVGNRLINTPLNSGSLWSKHRLLESDRRSLGSAIGLVAVDRRPADIDNTAELPAYARWDAAVYSRAGRWDLNVYFENIFGTRYYLGSESAVRVYPGAPFTVRGALNCSF